MSRTHHAVAYFRLSCNCVQGYNSFPEAKHPTVLCGNCGESSTIDFRYPDDSESCGVTCRAARPEGGNIKVRCTRSKPGHKNTHYDISVNLEFEVPGRLKAGRCGNT